jgi:hypothetical protein
MAKPPINLQLTVEFVTPELAEEWLAKNTKNRKKSDKLISKYAEAMGNQEWRLNGEAIIFDRYGRLQSGQHRLMACVQAETGFWTVVVRNAEPEALYTLDTGRKRTLSDALQLAGHKDTANLATAITWVWRYEVGAMDRSGDTATTSHYLKVLESHPELEEMLVVGRQYQRALGFSTGIMTALHWAFSQVDKEDANAFVSGLQEYASGKPILEAGDPRLILHRWAMRAKLDTRRPSQTTIAAVTIKAWNAWREHRELRSLSFRGMENFPEVV